MQRPSIVLYLSAIIIHQLIGLNTSRDRIFPSWNWEISEIIIRCVFFFLSIGRQSTTWPANNCPQIMVCSCVVPSKRVLLQIIFCSCVIGTTFSREKWQIASLSCQEVIKIWKHNLGDRMIKQLLNSVITNYHDLPVSRRSIIELLATDKSRYFLQPRPIIVNYFHPVSTVLL